MKHRLPFLASVPFLLCLIGARAAVLQQDLTLSGALNNLKSGATFTNSGTIAGAGLFDFRSGSFLLPTSADPGSPSASRLWLSTSTPDTLKYRSSGTTFSIPSTTFLAATYQPLDSDLTALAALTTTSSGRSILTYSAAAADMIYWTGAAWAPVPTSSAGRSLLGIGFAPTGTLVGTSDAQTLSGKSISGATNTLSSVGNSSLTNSAITIAGVSTSLGGAITATTILDNLGSTPGQLLYRGASSWSALAAGTTTQILHGGTTPGWAAVSLTADVSGTLPIANGGTGQTTAPLGFNALAPSQTSNSGKFLTTDGTNTSWASVTQPSAANPSGTISGTVGTFVNGSATTFMRSDAAPMLPATITGLTSLGVAALTNVATITGGAGNMTITAGTGNSRTLALQSTTAGGTATTFLMGSGDQSSFAGNVGIGTMTPVYGLTVSSGTSGFPQTSGGAATTGILRITPNSVGSSMDFGVDSASPGASSGTGWIQMRHANDLSSNYALVLNPNRGNVGIGTTEPQRLLDARGYVNLGMSAADATSPSGYADIFLRQYSGAPLSPAKIHIVDNWFDLYSTHTDGYRLRNYSSNGVTRDLLIIDGDGNVEIRDNLTVGGGITAVGGNTPLITSRTTYTSSAGASTGTLTNAPSAGNPTSWIKMNDNGTTRYIPAW